MSYGEERHGDDEALSGSRKYYAHFFRHFTEYRDDEFDSIDEALLFLAYGEDSGNLSTCEDAVLDSAGNAVATRADMQRVWDELP
jgi:hypothetical protein